MPAGSHDSVYGLCEFHAGSVQVPAGSDRFTKNASLKIHGGLYEFHAGSAQVPAGSGSRRS